MAQRNVRNVLPYEFGYADGYNQNPTGTGSVTSSIDKSFWTVDAGASGGSRAYLSPKAGSPQLEADQWYFFGVPVGNYAGPASTQTSFRFLGPLPDDGNINHPITGDGFWGITFKYNTPQTPEIYFGISPLGGAEPADISYDVGMPILCKVDSETGPICEPAVGSWTVGFPYQNGNSFNPATGVATLAQGAPIAVTNPQSVMFNTDSFGATASANSYPNLYQDSQPEVQCIPNCVGGRTLNTFISSDWPFVEDLSNVTHNYLSTLYRVNFYPPIIDTKVAVLDMGKNDIYGGDTAANVFSYTQTQIANYQAAGINSIIVCNCPPKNTGTGPQNAERDALNASLDTLTGVIIFDMYGLMVDPGDPDMVNPALSSDGFHPSNPAGHQAVFTAMAPIINALLAAEASSGNIIELIQVGTNGAFYSFADLSVSLSELDSAYFSNAYAASILKVGDVLLLRGADGTALVRVTSLDREQRLVTLSSGLPIA